MQKFWDKIQHWFLPRASNNHRAKFIHSTSISTYIVLLLVFQIIISSVSRFSPGVLAYATNVTVNDLLADTNAQRIQNGLQPLVLNGELSNAAQTKGEDMFAHQYWAHNSPQGRTPWSFILDAGYNYLYAGENLARDFPDSVSVVQAWMNSPDHRENLLNPRYKEIGFAIVNGKYGNYETTLVVQMFGTRQNLGASVQAPVLAQNTQASPSGVMPQASKSAAVVVTQTPPTAPVLAAAGQPTVFVDAFSLTKNISLGLTLALMLIFGLDALVVYRRRTVRVSGHSLAHMMLLVVLLVILNLVGRGVIL